MDVRGARSHGQEVLEPSVDLDATSTALPVDSRWSMLLGQPKRARQPRGHPTPGPAPHLEGPWALPSLKSVLRRLRGSGPRGLYGNAAVVAPAWLSTAAVAWHAAEQRHLAGTVHGAVTSLETAVEKLGAAFKE